MKRNESSITTEETIAIPMSIRLPAQQAYLLYLYSEQIGTSSGKMLGSILEDVFPAFESSEYKVSLRMAKVYLALKTSKLLTAVNEDHLKDRILKRTDPGGELGRPAKSRKIED